VQFVQKDGTVRSRSGRPAPAAAAARSRRLAQVSLFLSAKTRRMFLQKQKPANLSWTVTYRRLHKKDQAGEATKRKRRNLNARRPRAIVGVSMEVRCVVGRLLPQGGAALRGPQPRSHCVIPQQWRAGSAGATAGAGRRHAACTRPSFCPPRDARQAGSLAFLLLSARAVAALQPAGTIQHASETAPFSWRMPACAFSACACSVR